MDKLEMVETYNKDGVCVKRTINGHELRPDTEPSVQILMNITSVTQKFYITKEQFDYKYKHLLKDHDS